MRKNKRKYTDEQFIEAVKNSFSVRNVLRILKLSLTGGSYKIFYANVKRLNVDISHFTGMGHLKGKTHNWNIKIPLEEILVENSTYTTSSSLKERLIKENVLPEYCDICGLIEWRGKKLSLHIDHINGNNTDNRIENLRLLCPNCHSQTPTYCRKKPKPQPEIEVKPIVVKEIIIKRCIDCDKLISEDANRCKSCASRHRAITKIEWPSTEQLVSMVNETSYLAVSKTLGVSDNAVRKRIKNHPVITL